ncbi:MAG: hypothetical protein H6734_23980 [Alphaproteobacteria bacterium]|nr:hypothetical protein [Alphaproteobacteria bacterium]
MGDAVTIARLREQIRALEGGARVEGHRRLSGLPALDTLLGGLVQPGLVEISGPEGSGGVRFALALVAEETRRRRNVVWVDRARSLYPPAALAAGVDLDRLLIVRPPSSCAEGGRHAGTWAVEQVLRSGCFGLVVATEGLDPLGQPQQEHRFAGSRWRQAAEQGGCTGLFVTRSPSLRRILQADVRLGLEGRTLTVLRDRHGASGGRALLPPWPEDA